MRVYTLIIGFLFTFNILSAQEERPAEQVEVIKNFEARLADAEKINLTPKLVKIDTSAKDYRYNVNASSLELKYEAPTIRPIAMRPDAKPDAFNGFAMLGYGTPRSPIAELAYNFNNPGWYNVGINIKHHSADNSKKLDNQKFSETGVKLDGSMVLQNGITAGGFLAYNQDDYYLYGYDHEDTSFTRAEALQRYNLIEAGANLVSGSEAGILYNADLNIYRLKDNFATKENGILLNGGLKTYVNDKHALALDLSADLSTLKDTSSRSLNNLSAIPSFTFNNPNYQVKIGANLTSAQKEFKVFPAINISTKVIGSTLIAYIGADGGLTKNSFRNLSDYNPYITSRLDSINNNKHTSYYGGVKGALKGMNYQGQVTYKSFDGLALHVPDVNDMRRFQAMHDSGSLIQIKASASFSPIKQLDISANLSKNFYNMDREERAWSLPSFETNINAKYRLLKDKLHLTANLYLENGVPVMDFDSASGRRVLGPLLDLSIAADYFLTKNIGAFVHANNLANNKRMRWDGYASFGLNLKGGILARF
jgi:hypothetical protein